MAPLDPIWVQNGNYSATEDRMLLAALTGARHFVDLAPQAAPLLSAGGGHGVVGATDLAVSQNGTPNMTVQVAAGVAFIRGTQQANQGVYLGGNDAAYSVAIAAANATNPRKDLIVARITDTDYGAGASALVIEAVTGTAAGSPAEPTPPENSLVLALVDVPANDTAIGNAQITDRRTRANGLGGILPCLSTTRPNPATAGMVIYELDTGILALHNGTTWIRLTGSEATTAGTTALTTSFAAAASVTLPAGRWTVIGKGWFNWASSSPGEQFDAELWDGSTQRDRAVHTSTIGTGQTPFSLLWTVTLASPLTVSLRVKTSGLDGTINVENVKLSALPG